MFKNRALLLRNSGIVRSIFVLNRSDRRKLFLVIALQSIFNVLDLLAIAAIGVVGALSIRGIASQSPGDRVYRILNLLSLENQSFQFQVFLFTIVAMFLFVLRTFLSITFTKRTLRFLSSRSAQLTSTLFSKTLNTYVFQCISNDIHICNQVDNNILNFF